MKALLISILYCMSNNIWASPPLITQQLNTEQIATPYFYGDYGQGQQQRSYQFQQRQYQAQQYEQQRQLLNVQEEMLREQQQMDNYIRQQNDMRRWNAK